MFVGGGNRTGFLKGQVSAERITVYGEVDDVVKVDLIIRVCRYFLTFWTSFHSPRVSRHGDLGAGRFEGLSR